MNAATSPAKVRSLVEKVADAVLYEGYILYPYRPSAVKNRQRWNFGALCPVSYAIAQSGTENSAMRTECLIETNSSTTVDVRVRFLQLVSREVAERIDCQLPIALCHHVNNEDDHFRFQPSLEVNGKIFQAWQEAIEREVVLPRTDVESLCAETLCEKFEFPLGRTIEVQKDQNTQSVVGLISRNQYAVQGEIEIFASKLEENSEEVSNHGLARLSIVIRNVTPFEVSESSTRDDAMMRSLVSTHTILEINRGAFISLLDPPEKYKLAAEGCTNVGTYPVLVGEASERNCILSSPIILYDYPQIAPESTGDLFDGTEIDEILTLRIMTLTDEEKREMRSADELARQLLERTENLQADQMIKLHGVMKGVKS